jgi:hypothetical protein
MLGESRAESKGQRVGGWLVAGYLVTSWQVIGLGWSVDWVVK